MCGIAGVWNHTQAARLTWWQLLGEQHRAQWGAGIVTSDGHNLRREVGRGIVTEAITDEQIKRLNGRHAVGHIRYPTTRGDDPGRDNIQPIMLARPDLVACIAHNGNLTNVPELLADLRERDPDLELVSSLDSELILQRFRLAEGANPEERLVNALVGVTGSYCILLMLPDRIIAARDPSANQPLSMAQIGESYFFASETSGLKKVQLPLEVHIDDMKIREIEPGEMISVSTEGVKTLGIPQQGIPIQRCCFQDRYFAFPSSTMDGGTHIATRRQESGRLLAQAYPVSNADVVVGVPESALDYAIGYAEELNIKRARALLRSHFGMRTFIDADAETRWLKVVVKLHVDDMYVYGKSVVLIDDSIVRLTTMPWIVKMLKLSGAKEIHVRIGCAPVIGSCFYGIDTPTTEELGANNMTIPEMRERLGADSLEFLTVEQMRSQYEKPDEMCMSCLTGNYKLGVISG